MRVRDTDLIISGDERFFLRLEDDSALALDADGTAEVKEGLLLLLLVMTRPLARMWLSGLVVAVVVEG